MSGSRILQAKKELKEVSWSSHEAGDHVNDMQYDVTLLMFPPNDPDPFINDSSSSCVLHESLKTDSQQTLKTR